MVEGKEMHRIKSMVKLFFVPMMAVFVTLLIACDVAARVPIPNLVTNPGFEGTYSEVAPDWTPGSWGGATITYSRNTSIKHNGTSCQKVQISSLPAGAGAFMYSPMFSITAGHTYQMSMWVRSDSTARVQIMFRDFAAMYQPVYACKTVTANTNWQLVTCNGGPNYSSSQGQFLVAFATTGTVYLDDAAVVDTTATGSIIGGKSMNPNAISAGFFGIDVNHSGNFWQMPPIGAGTVRLWNSQCTWDYVEATQGTYNFGNMGEGGTNQMFQNAGSGTDIIYTIGGESRYTTPSWVPITNGRPSDLSANGPFAAFMRAFAYHVKNYRVNTYYEVINEVDMTPISPADGIALTDTVKTAVTNQDPSAMVIAPDITIYGLQWLDEWLRLGGGTKVKAMAFHRYQNAAPEGDMVTLTALYDLMCNYNVTSAPAVKYEAEKGRLGGPARRYIGLGASGGYAVAGIRGIWSASDTITVNASRAGIYNLRIHFANDFAKMGSMNLSINGGLNKVVYVPMTGRRGASYEYADIYIPIALLSGSNTLAFKSDKSHDGGLNLDYITIAPLLPLWDTEGSAGGYMPGGSTPADTANAMGSIARRHILEWLFGVSKTAWYCWDTYYYDTFQYGNMVGTPWKLCQAGDQTPNVYGNAYAITASWLTGATMTDWACCRNVDGQGDDVWIVDITRPGGYAGYILWAVGPNASGVSWTIPAVWPVDQVHDLWGASSSFTPGGTWILGPAPVLFD